MAQAFSSTAGAEKNGSSAPSSRVIKALNDFKVISSTTLRWILEVLPSLFLIGVLFVLGASDLMFTTGVLAAVLALFVFIILMERIPDAFATLWFQKIITTRKPSEQGSDNQDTISSASLEKQYIAFIKSFESLLNSPAQWALGIVFAFLGFVILLSQNHGLYLLWPEMNPIASMYSIALDWSNSDFFGKAVIVAQPLLGLLLGFVAWRMIITGTKIFQLGKEYGLSPRIGHPDMCGGLEPLGNLCLCNAIILAIPAIYLSGWVMLVKYQPYQEQYGDYYVGFQAGLLIIPIVVSTISFFLPIWSVHQIMLEKRQEERLKLDTLGKRIDLLEDKLRHQVLESANEMEIDDYQKISKELELLHQNYSQIWNSPTWPFNNGILRKFALAQIVPVLGLTNLGKPILDVVNSLLTSLGPR